MGSYSVFDTHEFGLDYKGFHYLIIYGSHINGGFIAIPNWYVSVETSDCNFWDEEESVAKSLYESGKGKNSCFDRDTCRAIAKAVRNHYRQYIDSLHTEEKGIWQHFDASGRYLEKGEVCFEYFKSNLRKNVYYIGGPDIDGKWIACAPEQVKEVMEEQWNELRKKEQAQSL